MDEEYNIDGYEVKTRLVETDGKTATWDFTTKIDYGYTEFSEYYWLDEQAPEQEYQEQISYRLKEFVEYAKSVDVATAEPTAEEIEVIKRSFAKFKHVVGEDYDSEFEDFVGMINNTIDKMEEEK